MPDSRAGCFEDDELADVDTVSPWERRTSAEFDLTSFPAATSTSTTLPQLSQWVEQRITGRHTERNP